jgi:hypothetical protein
VVRGRGARASSRLAIDTLREIISGRPLLETRVQRNERLLAFWERLGDRPIGVVTEVGPTPTTEPIPTCPPGRSALRTEALD